MRQQTTCHVDVLLARCPGPTVWGVTPHRTGDSSSRGLAAARWSRGTCARPHPQRDVAGPGAGAPVSTPQRALACGLPWATRGCPGWRALSPPRRTRVWGSGRAGAPLHGMAVSRWRRSPRWPAGGPAPVPSPPSRPEFRRHAGRAAVGPEGVGGLRLGRRVLGRAYVGGGVTAAGVGGRAGCLGTNAAVWGRTCT